MVNIIVLRRAQKSPVLDVQQQVDELQSVLLPLHGFPNAHVPDTSRT